mmetsp:Transcript_35832/g.52581  ORF Transcript_35832/g.52581 Transcript_35832/m.52581 type:complete len:96 (+) Transcript_35832:68-355(+)
MLYTEEMQCSTTNKSNALHRRSAVLYTTSMINTTQILYTTAILYTGAVERAYMKFQYPKRLYSVSADFRQFEWESLAMIRVSEYIKERKRTLCCA